MCDLRQKCVCHHLKVMCDLQENVYATTSKQCVIYSDYYQALVMFLNFLLPCFALKIVARLFCCNVTSVDDASISCHTTRFVDFCG